MKRIFTLTIIIFSTLSGFSQNINNNPEVENIFLEAVKEFENQKYESSLVLFKKLTTMQTHQRSTAAWIMLAKTYYHLENYDEAISVSRQFINQFPHSSYIDNAYFNIGLSQYKTGDYINAFYAFLNSIMMTKNRKIQNNILNYLQIISKKHLDENEAYEIVVKNENKETYDLTKAIYAHKLYENGNIKHSRNVLRKVVENPISDRFRNFVESIWEKIQRKYQLRIGVLVPLMRNYSDSPFSEVGEDLLAGINLAVEEFNSIRNLDYEIVLDIRDTERMPSKAANELKDLISEGKLLCVIGPVFSNEAQVCAEIAQKNQILMITPTATAIGIAGIGNYVFQANPDYRTRGFALARVAVEYLKLVNLAVIAPNEAPTKSLVESFVKEASRIGGNVVAIEYYTEGTLDLSDQFKNLRKVALNLEPMVSFSNKINSLARMKLIRYGLNIQFLDSLIDVAGSIGVNRLFGKNGRLIADSLGLVYHYPYANSDSGYFELNSIHGILFPINSSEEISIIAPQLSYYNLKTQILGTSEWYEENELQKNKNYTEETIFISEFFIDEEDIDVKNFKNNYKKYYGRQPSKNSYYGYDVMTLLINLIKQGYINSEILQKNLSKVRNFQTLHSKISFNEDGVNKQFNILKYSNGKIKKIGDMKY